MKTPLPGATTLPAGAITVLLVLGGFGVSAAAFQPLITDDTGTQGRGGNQLELSLNHDRAKSVEVSKRTHTLPVVFTRGLGNTLDVFAGLSHSRIRTPAPASDASGNGNPSLGAKWRFYESASNGISFALKPEILLPVRAARENTGLGTGKASGNLTLILTREVPFGAVHVNAGVGRERFRDTTANPDTNSTRLSVAPVWSVNEQWKFALDVGTEFARAAGATVHKNFVELGAIYAPNANLDFGLGIVHASDNGTPGTTTNSATAGVTWRFR